MRIRVGLTAKGSMVWLSTIGVVLLAPAERCFPQVHRPYEPVVVVGDSLLAAAGLRVDQVRLWAYQADVRQWTAVPLQIDEVNPKVAPWNRYFTPEDSLQGIFDLDDELVVMARDLGDQADSTAWLGSSDSLRFELEFTDSLDGKRAFLYLYPHIIDTQIPAPYGMAYDSLNDRIVTAAYQVGFNQTGQLAEVVIPAAVGGSGQDLFDRFKVRMLGSWLFFPIRMDEELIRAEKAYARVGPVRIIRNLDARFKFDLLQVDQPFTQTVLFYPYSGSFILSGLPLEKAKDFGAQVDVVRASWDMSPSAAGMRFYSASNPEGVPVDGVRDHVNTACSAAEINWTLLTGAPGSMVNLFYVPPLGDRVALYYHDATDGTTADGSPLSRDTGDGFSYGDNGFLLSGNIESFFGPGVVFSVMYQNYFLPPDISPEEAARMCAQATHPLQVSVRLQRRATPPSAAEAAPAAVPLYFALGAYPNPSRGTATVSFLLRERCRVSLELYDAAGRLVRRLREGETFPGTHQVNWDGNDALGRPMPSGVYFCRLRAEGRTAAAKLLLVR
ncbi:MAG: FlgD immunoglobulin-like domain containing protein [Candidatus Oleimicrobiaceae bacterium]